MVELPAGSFVGKNWNTKELEGTILGSEGISNYTLLDPFSGAQI